MTDQKSPAQQIITSSAKQALGPQDNATPSSANGIPQIIINIPNDDPKQGPADILNGVAAILWPLLIALVIVIFHAEIVSLVRRIRKGKAFGAEAEFDKDLEALDREVKKAKEQVESISLAESDEQKGQVSAAESVSYPMGEVRTNILAEAARSPRLGLMLLSAEIDKLARRNAASSGHHDRSSLRDQLEVWGNQIPPHVSAAYRLFADIRNRIVHGRTASEADILSAIDSGLVLYDALAAIPLEENVVAHPGVDIFSDAGGTELMEGKGLIIETTHQGLKSIRIFPTLRTHFRTGMRLTWEWNMSRIWQKAWYRDPENGEIKEAWGSSAEFVGRDLDQI